MVLDVARAFGLALLLAATPAASAAPLDLPADANLQAAASSTPADVAAPAGSIDTIFNRADALLAAMPASQWTIDGLAVSFANNPQSAFDFVRDRIALDAYAGELRGAEGTLGAQAGNPLDRAVLLQTLLTAMNIPARLAFATLDDATAQRLLVRSMETHPARPQAALDAAAPPALTSMVATRAARDYALLRASLGSALDGMTGGDDLHAAGAALAHHAWVQAQIGGAWVDLDPSFADAVPGKALVPAQSTAEAPADADRDAVDMVVEIETLVDGALISSKVMTRRFIAADDAAAQIFFMLTPDLRSGASVAGALQGTGSLVPQLLIDGTVEQGTPVALGVADEAGAIGGVIGALDPNGGEAGAELVAMRLHFTIVTPEGARPEIVRTLIDRLPSAKRGGSLTSADLAPLPAQGIAWVAGTMHQIVISTGGTNPAQIVVDRARVAEMALAPPPDSPADISFGAAIWPLAVGSRTLPAAIEIAGLAALNDRPDLRAFIAEPQLTIVSTASDGSGAPDAVSIETDLAYAPVRILSAAGVPAAESAKRRIWYGALGTAFETVFVQGGFAGGTGAALASASLAGPPGPVLSAVPDAAPGAMREASAAGLLIAPVGNPANAAAWWTIDPKTGATRSVMPPGLGMGKGTGPRGRLPGDYNGGHGVNDVSKQAGEYNRPKGSGYKKPPPGKEPQTNCRAGNEEMALITCVSIPGSVQIGLAVGSGVAIIVEAAILVIQFFF